MEHNAPEYNTIAIEHNGLENDSEILAAPIKFSVSTAISPCTCRFPMTSELWQAVRERNADLVRSIIQVSTFDLQEVYCPGTFYCSDSCYNRYVYNSAPKLGNVWSTLATFMPLLHLGVTIGEHGTISHRSLMGANHDARDSRCQAALEYAMECQNQAVIDLLAAYEAIEDASLGRIPEKGYTQSLGIRIRSMEMVKLTLQHGTGLRWKSANRWTVLHIAAANGHDNPELMTRLMDCGSPINRIAYYDGCSPLHYAIKFMTQPQTVELLLQRKADPCRVGYDGNFPLMMAVERGLLTVVKSLLRHKASPNQRLKPGSPTVLQVACNQGNESIALELIKAGARLTDFDQNGTYVIHSVVKSGMFPVIKEVVKRLPPISLNVRDSRSYTPLLWACKKADKNTVKLLLDGGACIKDKTRAEESVLHCVALTFFSEHAAVEVAEYLIDKGADAINKFDRRGFTPLHIACIKNQLALVDLFSKRGANIHLRTNQYDSSPLLLAVKNGGYASVLYFLNLGLKINEVYQRTGTALHLACKHERRETIQLLLDQGADINILNSFKLTPFSLINHKNVFESCKIMIRHMAKMTIRGEHVNEMDLHTISTNEELCEIYDNCIVELTMMRTSKFYRSITWLDLLFMPHAELETLCKNCMFVETTVAHLKKKPYPYPLYHHEVRAKLESSWKKRIIVKEAEQFVFDNLSDYLPVEITQHIARLMMWKELNEIENRRLFNCQ